MNKVLEEQLKMIIELIKKSQRDIKSNTTSVLDLEKDGKDLVFKLEKLKEYIDKSLEKEVSTLIRDLNTIREQFKAQGEVLNTNKEDYIKNNKSISNDLKIGLEEIYKKLGNFIKNEDLIKLEEKINEKIDKVDINKKIKTAIKDFATKNELQDVLKNIKIEKVIETKETIVEKEFIEPIIEIGKVHTLGAGMEASIEVIKKDNKIILEFYIPRGVSGRGMPGINGENATINGVNTLTIVEGTNIEIEQVDDTLTINATSEPQIQSDYTQTDNTKVDFIKNKPTIPDISGLLKKDQTIPDTTVGKFTFPTVEVTGALEIGKVTAAGFNHYFTSATQFSNGYNINKRGTTGDVTSAVKDGGELGYHSFYGWDGSNYKRMAYVQTKATNDTTPSAGGASYRIATRNATTNAEAVRLFIKDDGMIGIGNSTPTEQLDVTGNIKTSTGIISSNLTASELVATDGNKKLQTLAIATYPSLTELSYVKGVLGGIQGQLNGKQQSGTYATGTGTASGTNTGDETTTRIGALINGATAKTTPVDNDMFALMDSAASNVVKKFSWANIKTMFARKTSRVFSTTSATSVTPEISTYDIWTYTALAADFTINNHSTSTPTDGERMIFRFLDNGTARQLYYGTNYVAKAGVPLPLTTVISKNLTMCFEWNTNLSKWNLLAVGLED